MAASDPKTDKLRQEVFKRDGSRCRLGTILTQKERNTILDLGFSNDWALKSGLVLAHIEGRGRRPDLKYDPDNCLTLCDYFHTLLDEWKDPITRKPISEEERKEWFERIKKSKSDRPIFYFGRRS